METYDVSVDPALREVYEKSPKFTNAYPVFLSKLRAELQSFKTQLLGIEIRFEHCDLLNNQVASMFWEFVIQLDDPAVSRLIERVHCSSYLRGTHLGVTVGLFPHTVNKLQYRNSGSIAVH